MRNQDYLSFRRTHREPCNKHRAHRRAPLRGTHSTQPHKTSHIECPQLHQHDSSQTFEKKKRERRQEVNCTHNYNSQRHMICCIWTETKNQHEMLINYLMTHINLPKLGAEQIFNYMWRRWWKGREPWSWESYGWLHESGQGGGGRRRRRRWETSRSGGVGNRVPDSLARPRW